MINPITLLMAFQTIKESLASATPVANTIQNTRYEDLSGGYPTTGRPIPLTSDGSCIPRTNHTDVFVRVDASGQCLEYRVRLHAISSMKPFANGTIPVYDIAMSAQSNRTNDMFHGYINDPRNCLGLASGLGYQPMPEYYTTTSLRSAKKGKDRIVLPPCPNGYLPVKTSTKWRSPGQLGDLHFWREGEGIISEKRGRTPAVAMPLSLRGTTVLFPAANPTTIGGDYIAINGLGVGPNQYQPHIDICVRQGLNAQEVKCAQEMAQRMEQHATGKKIKAQSKHCTLWGTMMPVHRNTNIHTHLKRNYR